VTAREAVAGSFCAVGAVFFILGTVGLLRMPDFYSRLHSRAWHAYLFILEI